MLDSTDQFVGGEQKSDQMDDQHPELNLAETRRRFNAFLTEQKRSRADTLSAPAIRELTIALNLIDQAQEQLAGTRDRIEQLQRELADEQERYAELVRDGGTLERRRSRSAG